MVRAGGLEIAPRAGRALLATLALAILRHAVPAHGLVDVFTGRCVGVLDGDSIEVLGRGRQVEIRLEGIDAPEKGQAFADRAKQALSELISEEDVEVAGSTTDNYGRLVARVSIGGLDVNLEMVRRGLAWHYKRYSSDVALAQAEATARARRAGLWVDSQAVPPWSFRRAAQTRAPASGAASSSSTPAGSTAGESRVASGEVFGNTGSGVFHAASCTHSRCSNCTARFDSEEAARAAGYRPAGCCHPRQP